MLAGGTSGSRRILRQFSFPRGIVKNQAKSADKSASMLGVDQRSAIQTSSAGNGLESAENSLKPTEFLRFEALYELAAAMTNKHNLDDSLSLLVQRTKDMLGMDAAFVALRDLPAGDLHVSLSSGITTEQFTHLRVPFGAAIRKGVLDEGRVYFVEDYQESIPKRRRKPIAAEGLVSGLIAPIRTDAVIMGVLCAFNRSKCSFPQPVQDTLSLLANLAAVEISHKGAEKELGKAREALDKEGKERITELRTANEKLKLEMLEHQRAEEALRTERKRLNGLSELAPFGIAILDDNRTFQYMNPKFIRIFGYDMEESPDFVNWAERILLEKDRGVLKDSWSAGLLSSTRGSETLTVICKDGSMKIVDFRSVRLDTSEIMMTCIEVTEQEVIADALRDSKQRYQSLFESMLDAFAYHKIIVDGSGRPVDYVILDINNAYERLVGQKRSELIGRRISEVMPEIRNSSFDWVGIYGQIALAGQNMRFEKYMEPLGQWHSISAYSPWKGYFVTVVNDISDRKAAEEKIEQQSLFLAEVFDSLTHPFFCLDVNDYSITMANEAAGETVVGSKCFGLFYDRTAPCGGEDYSCPLLEVKKHRKPFTVEHARVDKAGHHRFVEVHGYPLFDQDGQVTQMILYYLDITERKRAHQLLIESERFKAIAEIAAGVAHNFNNLLQVVSSRTEIASMQLQTGDRHKAQAALQQALETLNLGTQTVKRLQDFARTRTQAIPSDRAIFDLTKIVEQAIDMSRSWWDIPPDGKRGSFTVKRDLAQGCFMSAKPSELFEVAVNLIKNAVEAQPDGGEISIQTSISDGNVVFSVADSGIGMSPEDLGKIFEPFWTTKGTKGTGMGLSSSYGIVRSYGGEISVASTLGEGATFTLTFPLVSESDTG